MPRIVATCLLPVFFFFSLSTFLCARSKKKMQTASHHLDRGSVLNMVVSSLQECIINYVPQHRKSPVDSI